MHSHSAFVTFGGYKVYPFYSFLNESQQIGLLLLLLKTRYYYYINVSSLESRQSGGSLFSVDIWNEPLKFDNEWIIWQFYRFWFPSKWDQNKSHQWPVDQRQPTRQREKKRMPISIKVFHSIVILSYRHQASGTPDTFTFV